MGKEATAQSRRPAHDVAESSSRWKGGEESVGGMVGAGYDAGGHMDAAGGVNVL